jgi:outer membrane lipoprotein-sorting protein
MKMMLRRYCALALLVLWSGPLAAQSADDIVEKYLAATGGRAALTKLTSTTANGSITLTSPVGQLAGTIQVSGKPPNKSRTLITLDLSSIGGGKVTFDQRFDGTAGYVIDTLNGNREITGGQLDAMRNGAFPTPLLNYRARGSEVALADKEHVGANEAYVVRLTPKAGPAVRLFIDTESFMLVKTVMTINIPQMGGDIDQVVEFSDFRDVDGIKVPHTTRSTNAIQAIVATMTDVKHNLEIDDSSFSRPAGQ